MTGRTLLIVATLVGVCGGAWAQGQTQVPATTSTRTTVGGQVDEKTRAAEEAVKPKAAEEAAKQKLDEKSTKPKPN
ncbi:hypothetical protein [Desertibaculum subflavum]|uniref:hypothetical protein n=1 Tax=Desertibaculum subflavum TaxID=2268458 RepID=UPI000E6633CF